MVVQYERLLDEVCRTTGLAAGPARAAAEAVLTTLARRLDVEDRRRLLDALPTELRNDFATSGPQRDWGVTEFVREVSLLGRREPEQAQLRTQAVLTAFADQDSDLVASLDLPDDIRDLFAAPVASNGITAARGQPQPLTAEEVAAALRRLPNWSGDTHALVRTIAMPDDSLDRVIGYIERLRVTLGRGPRVRRNAGTADLLVYTRSVNAVTDLDVDLAARIDQVIDDASAGMQPR